MLPDIETIVKAVYTELDKIEGLTVSLTLPETTSVFPVAVIAPPIQRGQPHKQYIDMQFTVEVWDDSHYETIAGFGDVVGGMTDLNLGLRNSTPIYQDPITKKFRLSGSFEGRFNCLTGEIERNF